MASAAEIQTLAQSGAESVYAYIERMAEPVEGGYRWETLNYQNEPQYNPGVFNGVAGISFFLADYFKLTGDDRARELALGACGWSFLPTHEGFKRGLCTGRVGVGKAWLHLADVLEDSSLLEYAKECAQPLLDEDPGPVTDILGGAAGNGIFLLRLWESTKDERYLQGAVRNGEWLEQVAERNEDGIYWPMRVGEDEPWYALGFAHGSSGTAHFLLHLAQATKDARWQQMSEQVLAMLNAQAQPVAGGLNWPPSLDGPEAPRCQWCHGAAGVGLPYVRAAEFLGEAAYRQTAEAAGEATYRYGDIRDNPSQCHGLAGNGELFIELNRLTGEHKWLEYAADFAEQAFKYRKEDNEGVRWGADEEGFYSPDFMCGASGTGHFFLRLWAPDTLRIPLY